MKFSSLPKFAVVLFAVVALALSGLQVAHAAGVTANQAKKIANKAITARAPGLTVAKAGNATNAKNADVAATANSVAPDAVTTNGIVNSTITGSDIASGTIPAGDIASGVVPTVLWARVNSGGSIASSRGATASVRNSIGSYTVTFNQTVSTCAAVVTPLGDQYVYYTSPSSNQITVDIELPDTTSTQVDTSFSLAVFC